MAPIEYPVALTRRDWDKRKPILATNEPTGIGEALAILQKMHNAVPWTSLDLEGRATLGALDGAYDEAVRMFSAKVRPIAVSATHVSALATRWTGEAAKDRMIPKAAHAAIQAVAAVAADYAERLTALGDLINRQYARERQALLERAAE